MRKLSKRHRARSSLGEVRPFEGMRQVNPHAAASTLVRMRIIVACVPDGHDPAGAGYEHICAAAHIRSNAPAGPGCSLRDAGAEDDKRDFFPGCREDKLARCL